MGCGASTAAEPVESRRRSTAEREGGKAERRGKGAAYGVDGRSDKHRSPKFDDDDGDESGGGRERNSSRRRHSSVDGGGRAKDKTPSGSHRRRHSSVAREETTRRRSSSGSRSGKQQQQSRRRSAEGGEGKGRRRRSAENERTQHSSGEKKHMRRRSAEGGMEGAKLSLTPTESFARNFRYQDPEKWRQKVEQDEVENFKKYKMEKGRRQAMGKDDEQEEEAALKYNLAGKGEHMEKAKMDAYKQYRQQAKSHGSWSGKPKGSDDATPTKTTPTGGSGGKPAVQFDLG